MPHKDPVKKREYDLIYKKKHKKHLLKLSRDWKKRNPEKCQKWNKKWRDENPEKFKQLKEKYKKSGKTVIWHRKCRYGIDENEFNEILNLQSHICPICKKDFMNQKKYLDHDHKTGKIRGILHHKCNLLLGNCNDDISILKNAIKYLRKNS